MALDDADRRLLDAFGKALMEHLRDRAIGHYDRLAQGKSRAPTDRNLQADLASLGADGQAIARRCLIEALDVGLHDFLFFLHEQTYLNGDIQLLVQGTNIVPLSDDIHGELFSEEGWRARFSAYGEPPEDA